MTREELIHDLFRAYFDARKNKRNTVNQLRFELNYEQNLMILADEIFSRRKYLLNKSHACFRYGYFTNGLKRYKLSKKHTV